MFTTIKFNFKGSEHMQVIINNFPIMKKTIFKVSENHSWFRITSLTSVQGASMADYT